MSSVVIRFHVINTPRGAVYHVPAAAGGEITAKLDFNPEFGQVYTDRLSRAQMYVDSEVLRFCSARVPFKTGMLQKSGILGTVIGSGEIQYVAPYAARQYYRTAQTRIYDANRGAFWFERGKAAEKDRILRGAMRIAGGGQ